MSVHALTWALDQTTEQPVDKLILICLANYADEVGMSFPGRARLARVAMCSLDTVDRAIKRLVAARLLEKSSRLHASGGASSNCYTICLVEGAANCGWGSDGAAKRSRASRMDAAVGAANCGDGSRIAVRPPQPHRLRLQEPSLEPSNETKSPPTPEPSLRSASAPSVVSRSAEVQSRDEADTAAVEPDAAPAPDTVAVAFAEFQALARRLGLPVPGTLTPPRRRSLRARIAEVGLDGWRLVLAAIEASDFLRGVGGRDGWKGAGIDFVLQPSSFAKIREGNYANRRPAAAAAAPRPSHGGAMGYAKAGILTDSMRAAAAAAAREAEACTARVLAEEEAERARQAAHEEALRRSPAKAPPAAGRVGGYPDRGRPSFARPAPEISPACGRQTDDGWSNGTTGHLDGYPQPDLWDAPQ